MVKRGDGEKEPLGAGRGEAGLSYEKEASGQRSEGSEGEGAGRSKNSF